MCSGKPLLLERAGRRAVRQRSSEAAPPHPAVQLPPRGPRTQAAPTDARLGASALQKETKALDLGRLPDTSPFWRSAFCSPRPWTRSDPKPSAGRGLIYVRGRQVPPVFVRGRTPPSSDCWLIHTAQGAGSLSCSRQWAVFCGVL